MSSDCTPPICDMLTHDLITEILVRLPVKSILRCKSVSKPWLSLISNPNFIISHLKHSITKPGADQTLIVTGGDFNNCLMFLLHLDSCQVRAPLGYFSFARPFFQTVGCCNGIVCFHYAPHRTKNPYTYLWNPATRQAKLIPPHNIPFREFISVFVGFGFDPIGNDYKVVTILTSMGKPWTAEVYSATTNVWRRVEPNPKDLPSFDEFDVCVNGFLCCVGSYGMMAFDFNKEVFTCGIKLPNVYWPTRVTDFNDSIVVIASKEYKLKNVLNLWKLDDEACLRDSGIEASWTLMHSIDVGHPVSRIFGYFNSGDLLLSTGYYAWLLYNSDKKEARNVPVSLDDRQTFKYNESLVSITGFKQVNWNACEDDN